MAKRHVLANVNLGVTVLLLAALLLLVNFIGSRRFVRVDLTKTKITELSSKTNEGLRHLKDPVRIVVFYQPSHRLYDLVENLLKEYEAQSKQLKIEYVDPEQDLARARQLVQEFEIKDQINLVVFESSGRHKYLSDAELAEYDYTSMAAGGGAPSLKAFKGEDAFTSAILNVTQSTQPLVWFITGHGEKDVEPGNPQSIAELKKSLERENMTVESVTLLDKKEIPASVAAVLIAGPTRRYTEQELLLLESYLQRGGRLVALIDPLTNPGLDGLLEAWGVEPGMDIVVDPSRQLPFVSAANLFVTTYTQHPIVEQMERLMTLYPLARSVKPIDSRRGAKSTALALTSPEGWGETHVKTQPFQFNEGEDTKGPVPVAVASERPGSPATRLVVIGDSDFVSEGQLTNVGNQDLALGVFQWLVGQEQLIGIGPKPIESIKLTLNATQMRGILWFSLAVVPGLFAALGIAMWWRRRT